MGSNWVAEDPRMNSCSKLFDAEVRKQITITLKMALPLIIVNLTQFLIGPVSSAFCGHIGTYELDAVSVANSVNVIAFQAIFNGLATACDALMSQIYGSSNKKLMGVVLQRNFFILFLISLLTTSIYLNIERFLLAVGQDPIVSRMAADYLIRMIPSVYAFTVTMSLQKFLSTQNSLYPMMISALACNLLNIFFHWLFLYHYDFGTNGSAWSQAICYIFNAVSLLLYVICSGKFTETWDGWTWDLFQEWDVFLKLGIGGLVLVMIEWGTFEFGVFFSGLIGTISLAAQSIVLQVDACLYQIPLSVGIATSIQVGQNLGSAKPYTAKLVTKVGYALGGLLALMNLIFVVSLKDYIPRIFSDDIAVCELVSKILIIVACYICFDSIVCVSTLVMRGTGKVWTGALIISCCHGTVLLIGLPVMLWKQNIVYFWLILICGICMAAIVTSICVYRTNWNQLVSKALERAKVLPQDTIPEEQSNHFSFSEKSNLLHNERIEYRPTYSRRFSSYDPYQPSIENDIISPVVVATSENLSSGQLILRRGSVIACFLLILIASIFTRLYYPIDHSTMTNSTTSFPLYSTERITTIIDQTDM